MFCPIISYTKVSEKTAYTNSADPDPEGAVWSGSALFAIPLSILRNTAQKANSKPKKYLKF